MVLLSVSCFGEEPTKLDNKQLKMAEEKRKEVLTLAGKALAESQPDSVYAQYLKGEVMVPNLEPVKGRVYGNKTARNKMVIFADFACGHCKIASKELKARVNENKSLVNLTYVLYPLDKVCNKAVNGKLSDYSCVAARLALCAEKNGKVWKGIDYLYEHQSDGIKYPFDPRPFAKGMGKKLKIKDIDVCMNSKWVDDQLNNEQLVHKGLNIPGTPIVLLNNRRMGNTYKSDKIFGGFIKYLDLKEHPQGK
jgi:protein-disulfide isomerase